MMELEFFLGCPYLNKISELYPRHPRAVISVNSLYKKRKNGYECRKSLFDPGKVEILLDSGAFSRLCGQFGYNGHLPVLEYARVIRKFSTCGKWLGVVTQDWMCEEFVLEQTGLDILTHQRLTLEGYDRLREELGNGHSFTILPVLQGYKPGDYAYHVREYGDRIQSGDWVGVGSLCRRNASPERIREVLLAIHRERSDLRLHGFGVKKTALKFGGIVNLLYSADSCAWGLWSGKNRKIRKYQNSNSLSHALDYADSVMDGVQLELPVFGELQ